MENLAFDTLSRQLLEVWQRGFPIVERPFLAMAEKVGVGEAEVIARLRDLKGAGVIARVGGVVRPNTMGASTLAALAAPDLEIEATAQLMVDEPGINHLYLRENDWNLWFVATGPDRASVDATLLRIGAKTGRRVLDLRLERSYYIDLGFSLSPDLSGRHRDAGSKPEATQFIHRNGDQELVQQLTTGLPLVPRPFAAIGRTLARTEAEVIERIGELHASGILPRLGLIVRHRALGWRSNAMVVWDVPEEEVDRAGDALAAQSGINLCYRRTRYERQWPFNLYCMIHARSRAEALETLATAAPSAGLEECPRQILFSLRCFKQTGAMVAAPKEAA